MKREDRAKRARKEKVVDFDKLEAEMRRHYGWLLIQEAGFERRMRNRALRMSRARRKQIKRQGWVI